MGMSEISARTIAIETAMKSSAFGFLLATLHFKEYLVCASNCMSYTINYAFPSDTSTAGGVCRVDGRDRVYACCYMEVSLRCRRLRR
jgi:hypothetical protein